MQSKYHVFIYRIFYCQSMVYIYLYYFDVKNLRCVVLSFHRSVRMELYYMKLYLIEFLLESIKSKFFLKSIISMWLSIKISLVIFQVKYV